MYLSHIPPGFVENEMRKYFNQFGHVTRIKLARSKKTGKSKGHAFIEFRYSEVAKVVAETMNNYLMCNRLLKATFMDKKYSNNFWKPVTPETCARVLNRRKDLTLKNSLLSPAKELKFVKSRRRKLDDLLSKLKAQGIDYDFMPEDSTAENSQSTKSQHNTSSEEDWPVLIVDESDNEIDFKTPPNVIKRILKRSSPPQETETPKTKKQKGNGPENNSKSIKLTKNSNKKDSVKVPVKNNGKKPSRLPVPVANKQAKKLNTGISMNINGRKNKVQSISSPPNVFPSKKISKKNESNLNSSREKQDKTAGEKKLVSKIAKKVLGGKIQQKLQNKHFKPAKDKSKDNPKQRGQHEKKVFQSKFPKISVKIMSPSKSEKLVKKRQGNQSPGKLGGNNKKEKNSPQKKSPSNSAGNAKKRVKISQKKATKIKFSPKH